MIGGRNIQANRLAALPHIHYVEVGFEAALSLQSSDVALRVLVLSHFVIRYDIFVRREPIIPIVGSSSGL